MILIGSVLTGIDQIHEPRHEQTCFCICENKYRSDSCVVVGQLFSEFVFAT